MLLGNLYPIPEEGAGSLGGFCENKRVPWKYISIRENVVRLD